MRLKSFLVLFHLTQYYISDRKTQVVDEKGVPYVTEKSSMDFNSVPSAFTAFKA